MKKLAITLKAYVIGGYPEKLTNKEGKEERYNSMYVIDRTGKLIKNYRKHFLYETDKV